MIKSESFREFIYIIILALNAFIVLSSNIIRNQIIKLFNIQTLVIKRKLVKARLKIYISFDLQILLNRRLLVGIVAHWLNKDLKKQNILISLRRLKGSYSGENLAKVIIPVLQLFNLIVNLRYFISDNIAFNNVVVYYILRSIRSDIKELSSRHIKYLRYIINLVVKAFLFNNNEESFKTEEMTKKEI